VEFNAHRIHAVEEILEMFSGLVLQEFSIVTDEGELRENVPVAGWDDQRYGLGLFRFGGSWNRCL
jgi:hypothetical protein